MIVFRLIGLLLDVLLLPIRVLLRSRGVLPGTWLTVTIEGPVVDVITTPRGWRGPLSFAKRARKATSIHRLSEIATEMLRDRRVRGLHVTLRSMSAGMASATSLRAVLERVRASGKEVAVHLPMGGGAKEMLVASAASKVLVGPASELAPLGVRSASRYLKNALDRVGIVPQVFACGEFKAAGETLVRDSMSDAQRTQLERLLETFHGALVDGIASGRHVDRERAMALVDGAPYFGRAAVAAGLADDVAYEDEIPSKLGLERGRRQLVDAEAYLANAKRPLLRRLLPPPVVAVVPVHGAIAHAAGPLGGLSTDERVTRMVRAARRDRRVKGVILHVDSPGGSALASDLMHHEIEQLAREKPVVACMANVAASGGYYVAAPAACIVAEATTVTGSIGVVAARISTDPLLSRLGIVTEVVERGRHAALLSQTGPLTDELRETIERSVDAVYRAFVEVVASGRKLPVEEVERLARGRVYSGRDAVDAKLVDALGGFDRALDELKRRLPSRVRDRVNVEVVSPLRRRLPVPELPDAGDEKDRRKRATIELLFELLPERERHLLALVSGEERVLALSPVIET